MFVHDSFFPLDRRDRIADRLARGEAVGAGPLAREFGVSEDAIRRDLRALAADGLCRRVYGGALPLSPASTPIEVRAGEDVGRKRALARAALPLLRPGATLFLDTGSTVLQLAGLLPADRDLRVVTNSVPVAAALAARGDVGLVLVGGAVDPAVGGCVDAHAIAELRRFRPDLAFLGACALSLAEGLAGFEMADVDFKRALIEVSGATALMMTSAKLETAAPFRIAPVAALGHLVLEHDAAPALAAALGGAGPAILTAEPPQP